MTTDADRRAANDPRRARFLPFLAPSRGERLGKWVSADEAVAAIADHSRVFVAATSGTPMTLLDALSANRERWTDLELVMAYMVRRPSVFDHAGDPFRFTTTQATPAFERLWDTGIVSILPARYSDLSGLFLDSGPYPVDAALIQVSAPGPEGRVSLGTSAGGNVDVARNAPLVIAQVNEHVPYTFGASELEPGEIDLLVESAKGFRSARLADSATDEVVQTIARRAAELVPNGATLQFGVGAIPDAILAQLRHHENLSVHSGMVSMTCAELLEEGAITCSSKGFDDGYMITAEVWGTERMTKWVDRNPRLLMAPARYTHGAEVLARIDRFVALQSGVEVALDGAVNSETVGARVLSGPGGAPDYAFAASVAAGGRSILALKSVTGDGSTSRVVRSIESPNRVTIPYYAADLIVTEYGVADVRGLALEARAQAIRAVAHPDHRTALA